MSRSNVAMAVAVVGLGAFYYLHDVKGAPEREKAETQSKRFFPTLEKPKVVGLKVEQLKKPTVISTPFSRDINRQNGIWVLDGKDPIVLRTTSMGSAIKTLVELQRAEDLSTLTPAPDRAEFGLDKPSYRLTLKDQKGQNYTLLVGDKTPDDQGYYVATGEKDPICAINGTMPELLESSVDTIRETSPIVFEPSTANKIVIETGAGKTIELALAKARESDPESDSDDGIEVTDLNEEWLVKQPEQVPADGNKVRNLLWDWRNVKLGRFMKNTESVDFSKPVVKMTVYVDGQKDPFVIEVGGVVPGKPGLYYARRSSPTEQMVLELSDFKLLEPTITAFQEKHIYVFQPEDADRVQATVDGLKIEAKRSGTSWKVNQPKVAGADESKQSVAAGDLVWEVKNLEWTSKPDPKDVPKDWKERAVIEVWSKDKKVLGKLSLGPSGKDNKGAYIRDDKGTTFYLESDPFKRWQDIKKRVESKASATPTATPKPAE